VVGVRNRAKSAKFAFTYGLVNDVNLPVLRSITHGPHLFRGNPDLLNVPMVSQSRRDIVWWSSGRVSPGEPSHTRFKPCPTAQEYFATVRRFVHTTHHVYYMLSRQSVKCEDEDEDES
jgi:hypothetical protein